MRAIELNNTEISYNNWNNFVERSPQGSIYNKTWYLEALRKSFSIIVVLENECIIAGCILVKNEIGIHSNPLLCKYLGVLFDQYKGNNYNIETKKRKIINSLLPEIGKYSFNYAFSPEFDTYLPFYWKNFSCTIQYTYQIDLVKKSKESIFKDMYTKLKNEILHAQKQNYYQSSTVDFNEFYNILNSTFKKQGGKAPWSSSKLLYFYETLRQKNCIQLNGIYNSKRQLMAVNGVVYDERACMLLFNGIDYNRIERGANELLLFETIIDKIGKSAVFDFEGSMIKQIESFYRKFGGDRIPFLVIFRNNLFNYFFPKLKVLIRKIKYKK